MTERKKFYFYYVTADVYGYYTVADKQENVRILTSVVMPYPFKNITKAHLEKLKQVMTEGAKATAEEHKGFTFEKLEIVALSLLGYMTKEQYEGESSEVH